MEFQASSRSQIKVVYEGKEYLLRKPTLGETIDLEKQLKESSKSEDRSYNEFQLNFLVARGLPKEVAESLDIDLVGEIVSALMPKKKT